MNAGHSPTKPGNPIEKLPVISLRQLARFLTGLTSPATTATWHKSQGARRKERLTNHPAFALLHTHPFSDTLALTQSLVID